MNNNLPNRFIDISEAQIFTTSVVKFDVASSEFCRMARGTYTVQAEGEFAGSYEITITEAKSELNFMRDVVQAMKARFDTLDAVTCNDVVHTSTWEGTVEIHVLWFRIVKRGTIGLRIM